MVVGIVHKNGILMLDSEQNFSGLCLPLRNAIFHAGRRRLRPILMTALATIFGMLPLAIGVGSGAQLLAAARYCGDRGSGDIDDSVAAGDAGAVIQAARAGLVDPLHG